MIRSTAIAAISALGLVALTLPACASKPPARPDRDDRPRPSKSVATDELMVRPAAMMLAALDTDATGALDIATIAAQLQHVFRAADTDGSGTLSMSEHASWAIRDLGDQYAQPSFLRLDTDRNSRVGPDEFSDYFATYASRMDANRDGRLERSELLVRPTAAPQRMDARSRKEDSKGERGGGQPRRR